LIDTYGELNKFADIWTFFKYFEQNTWKK